MFYVRPRERLIDVCELVAQQLCRRPECAGPSPISSFWTRPGKTNPPTTGVVTLGAESLTDRAYIATQTGPIKTLGSPLLIPAGLRAEY